MIGTDINGDGDLDLVIHGDSGWLAVYPGEGNAFFRGSHYAGLQPQDVVAGDFDEDGRNDLLAVRQPFGNGASLLLNAGNGSFGPPIQFDFQAPLSQPESVVTGDFVEDGHLDIAVGCLGETGPTSVGIVPGLGNGNFGLQLTVAGGRKVVQLATDDLDGDGHLDLVAVGSSVPAAVQVWLGHGDGSFAPLVSYPIPVAGQGVTIGDLDGLAGPDLVVARADGFLSVLLNDGGGGFDAASSVSTGAGSSAHAIVLADLDEDGALDAVATDGLNSLVHVLSGLGDGGFGAPTSTDIGVARGYHAHAADVDGDGHVDVWVSSDPNAAPSYATLLRGLGDGGFAPPLRLQLPNLGGGLDVADLDGDGTLDLAITAINQVVVAHNRHGPWDNLGFPLVGTAGLPRQIGEGPLVAGTPFSFTLRDARPNAAITHFVGLGTLYAPFKGGTLVPTVDLINSGLTTDTDGTLVLSGTWIPAPSGLQLYLQFWLADPAGPKGLAASNALRMTLP
jgi:hypothetical protein